jgi:transcriptional regulator with XRE-family HTH domain
MAKRGEVTGLVEQLREAIRDSGKTLYQLSKDAGVGKDQLSRFMRGERTLTLPVAEKVCRALGLRLAPESRRRPAYAPRGDV